MGLDILHGMVGLIDAPLSTVSKVTDCSCTTELYGCRAERLTLSHTGTPPAGDMP